MAYKSLVHKEKRGSTVKWFVIWIIPITAPYWIWKAAEVVSGHEKCVLKNYETIKHMDKMESTGKWFGIFMTQHILLVLFILGVFRRILGIPPPVPMLIATIILGIIVLCKMAVDVSGHETWYPEKYEAVRHKEKKDSTAKWIVIGIIPILNLHFLCKMCETISGHETVHK